MAFIVGLAGCPSTASAEHAVDCGGVVMLGAAQLNCSHIEPKASAQFCTFSWSLDPPNGDLRVVEGSFLISPGASNVMVYQGSGFDSALSNPIVVCRGKDVK
jgi:hypothetical protein